MKYFTTKDGFFSGNVGIGTTSPNFPLHINKSDSSGCWTQFTNSATGTSSNSGALVGIDSNQDFRINLYEEKAIEFYTSGTQRMRIHSDGNVGIGTTSPDETLHVSSAAGPLVAILEHTDGGSAELSFRDTNQTDQVKIGTVDGGFRIYTSNEEKIRIDADGNVGIGTASPDFNLSVVSNTDPAKIGIHGYGSFSDGTVAAQLLFLGKDSNDNNRTLAHIQVREHSHPSGTGSMEFFTRIGGNEVARMTISEAGNVGIGTTSPSAKLEVAGGSLDINGTDDLRLRFLNAGFFKAGIQVPTTSGDMITGSGVNDLAIRSGANMLFAAGGSTERMRIDSSGNVGIGTTSPSVAKLQINGSSATSVRAGLLLTDSNTTGRSSAIHQEGHLLKFDDYTQGLTSIAIDGISGNVGIGTTNPDFKLTVDNGIGNYGLKVIAGNNGDSNESVIEAWNWKTNGSDPDLLFKVRGDGNVGIGTASPSSPLHVYGQTNNLGGLMVAAAGTNIDSLRFWIDSSSTAHINRGGNQAISITNTRNVGIGTTNPVSFKLNVQSDSGTVPIKGYRATADTNSYLLTLNSNIGTGSDVVKFRVEADGDVISATNSYTSDERAKSEISDLNYGLDKIKQLQPKQFKMRYSEEKGFKYGFIAQEVETILPDLIRNDGIEDGEGGSYKALEYNSIIAILTKAIQELKSEIDSLKFQLNPDNSSSTQEPVVEEALEESVAEEAQPEEVATEEPQEVAQVSLGASISSTSLDDISNSRAEEL